MEGEEGGGRVSIEGEEEVEEVSGNTEEENGKEKQELQREGQVGDQVGMPSAC